MGELLIGIVLIAFIALIMYYEEKIDEKRKPSSQKEEHHKHENMTVVHKNLDIITLRSEINVPKTLNEEHAKKLLLANISNELEPYVKIEDLGKRNGDFLYYGMKLRIIKDE